NGGVDLDASANTITVNVTSVNDAPAGANKAVTVLEDASYTFAASDFGFSDPNDAAANALSAVKISTLPAAGSLKLSGVAVTAGQLVSAADIAAGNLVYTPAANANGPGYASFTFQFVDDGGTANLGQNTDQSPNTLTFDVTSVNDAPAGTSSTLTILEDGSHTFTAADFGFTDPLDAANGAHGADAFQAVIIHTLPAAGTLQLSGVTVTADLPSFPTRRSSDLYTPAANANGPG